MSDDHDWMVLRERNLDWRLAEATCVVELLLLEHSSHPEGKPGITIYNTSERMLDRACGVFKEYP